MYPLNAFANVSKSPRISDGAAAAIAWSALASLATVASALPATGCTALAAWAPRAASFAQFDVFANVGAAEVVVGGTAVEVPAVVTAVVVAAEVVVAAVVVGEPDLLPPPQPAPTSRTATAAQKTQMNLIVPPPCPVGSVDRRTVNEPSQPGSYAASAGSSTPNPRTTAPSRL